MKCLLPARLHLHDVVQAVQTIHEARIVHSDLKPANFLMVEGTLKLIDFGIAKAIQNDTTSIARESQVGTLNYMSPEAILGGRNNIRGAPPMKVWSTSNYNPCPGPFSITFASKVGQLEYLVALCVRMEQ